MQNSASSNETIEQLRSHVELLTARMGELEGKIAKIATFWNDGQVHLKCNNLEIMAPNGETRIEFEAHDDLASITLCDDLNLHSQWKATIAPRGDEPRDMTPAAIQARAENHQGAGELFFYGRDGQTALRLHGGQGHGAVEAYAPYGIPAVALKSTEIGGVVSVVDEKGEVRVLLRNEKEGGRLEVFGPDQKQGGALMMAREGGMLTLAQPDAPPNVVMGSALGGALFHLGRDDQANARIIVGDDMAFIEVQGSNDNFSVRLFADAQLSSCEVSSKEEGTKGVIGAAAGQTSLSLNSESWANRVNLLSSNAIGAIDVGAKSGGASLHGSNDGSSQFALNGAPKQLRTMMQAGADTSTMIFFHPDSQPALAIANRDHQSSVSLYDSKGAYAPVALRTTKDGGGFALYSPQGNVALLSSDAQSAKLHLNAPDGGQRAVLAGDENGGSFALLNDAGSLRVMAGVMNDNGQLLLNRSGGDHALMLKTSDEGGQLLLIDENGETKLDLPDDANLF